MYQQKYKKVKKIVLLIVILSAILLCFSCSNNSSNSPSSQIAKETNSSVSNDKIPSEPETKINDMSLQTYKEYDPITSVVPGFPFTYQNNSEITIDKIEVTTDNGIFLFWDQDSGTVEKKGTKIECKVNDYFYWSNLVKESDNPIIEKANITMKAYNGTTLIYSQEILIFLDDYKYYANASEIKKERL